jgi:hypothetical protein
MKSGFQELVTILTIQKCENRREFQGYVDTGRETAEKTEKRKDL